MCPSPFSFLLAPGLACFLHLGSFRSGHQSAILATAWSGASVKRFLVLPTYYSSTGVQILRAFSSISHSFARWASIQAGGQTSPPHSHTSPAPSSYLSAPQAPIIGLAPPPWRLFY